MVRLHEPTSSEWQHEQMRITQTLRSDNYESVLRKRMGMITDPQKMYNYFRALEGENFHSLAAIAHSKALSLSQGSIHSAPARIPNTVRRKIIGQRRLPQHKSNNKTHKSIGRVVNDPNWRLDEEYGELSRARSRVKANHKAGLKVKIAKGPTKRWGVYVSGMRS